MQNFHWKNTATQKHNQTQKPPHNTQTKNQNATSSENSQNNVRQGETNRAPLSPSKHLFHHVVILQAIHVKFRCHSCQRLRYLDSFGCPCEAQNPKSKRFYQQLEPTTKQNHTVTRSVARSGKLEEPVNMQTQNHN